MKIPLISRIKRWMAGLVLFLLLGVAAFVLSQDATSPEPEPRHFGVRLEDRDPETPMDPRESRMVDRPDFPTWSVSKELPNDVFTFARLRYPSSGRGYRRRFNNKWLIDYPGSDLNFSYRLQQLTSLQVAPKADIVDIDPEQIRHYPFVYMLEVGDIAITDMQAHILRDYMMNGGFVMVDDNWGSREWGNWMRAFKQMFPDRDMVELTLDHEIFHIVFDLKIIPQIPGVGWFLRGYGYEPDKPDSEGAHYYGVYDDKGRMVMCICHNTDLGDGWEEEGTDARYFHTYSERYAYPLGINIVFYAMTH